MARSEALNGRLPRARALFLHTLALLLLCSAWAALAQPLVDPTRPPGWQAGAAPVDEAVPLPEFEVSMVKLSARLRLAVVNGRSVREGDSVDGATVVAIGRDAVEFEHQGRRVSVATPGGRTPRLRQAASDGT